MVQRERIVRQGRRAFCNREEARDLLLGQLKKGGKTEKLSSFGHFLGECKTTALECESFEKERS